MSALGRLCVCVCVCVYVFVSVFDSVSYLCMFWSVSGCSQPAYLNMGRGCSHQVELMGDKGQSV